jgi:Tol biopolymer transport system component
MSVMGRVRRLARVAVRPQLLLLLALAGCGGSDSSLSAGGEPVSPGGIPPALAEGSRLVFVSTRDGNQEIYAMRGDGSEQRNLTRHPAEDLAAFPVGDGSRLLFLSQRGQPPGGVGLFAMDADGSDVRDLERPVQLWGGLNRVTVSPDGRTLAYLVVLGEDCSDHELVATEGPREPRLLGICGQGVSPLAFSPDGATVAVSAFDTNPGDGLLVGPADGSGLRVLVPDGPGLGFGFGSVAFSPDGRRIAFTAQRRGCEGAGCPEDEFPSITDVFVIGTDGTRLQRLTHTRRPESDPRWSPDGSKLAFVRSTEGVEGYRDEGTEIYVLDLASGQEVNVSNSEADDQGPVWSPDGRWLAFTSDRDDDQEVYAVRADGTELTRLTTSPGMDQVAAWRAAGPGPAPQIEVFSTSGRPFTPGVRNQGWWNWNPNGVNQDHNDNYFVGVSDEDEGEYRNFFTFDLSSLTGQVISARLEITRFGYGSPDPSETLGLFDVSTDARTLNNNVGVSAAIFEDLGTGTSYGTVEVSRSGEPADVLSVPLNAAAVADINAAAGGFFSIGGRLLSAEPHQTLFANSDDEGGVQRLVVETVRAGGAAASP